MSHADIDIGGFYIRFDKNKHEYSPVEPISGSLCVNFRSDVKTKGLILKIVGKLGVLWQENENDKTDVKSSKADTFTTANQFLNEIIPFVLPHDDQSSDMTTISKGYHEFQFSFRLVDFLKGTNVTQQRIAATFPFSSEHEYGSVKYVLTGILQRSTNDFDYQTVQFIKIVSALQDSGDMHTHFLPYKTENTKDNSLLPLSSSSSSGSKSSLKVVCNKTAFKPGETINCLIKLENENALRKFAKLYVKLIQTATFHSKDPAVKTKSVKHDIFSYKQTDFDNNRYYEMDEIIQIPRSTQPPTTLDPSHHIQYKYDLKIELYSTIKFLPSAPSQPIELTIPIIIYNDLV